MRRVYSRSLPSPILVTKLYIPPGRPRVVEPPRLVERLHEGLATERKLTLISAPAGFGKTTLLSDWMAACGRPAAWLSLDAGDSDPIRLIDARPVDDALVFIVEHLPPRMHLAIATREDPALPLARWRARGKLTRPLRAPNWT